MHCFKNSQSLTETFVLSPEITLWTMPFIITVQIHTGWKVWHKLQMSVLVVGSVRVHRKSVTLNTSTTIQLLVFLVVSDYGIQQSFQKFLLLILAA